VWGTILAIKLYCGRSEMYIVTGQIAQYKRLVALNKQREQQCMDINRLPAELDVSDIG